MSPQPIHHEPAADGYRAVTEAQPVAATQAARALVGATEPASRRDQRVLFVLQGHELGAVFPLHGDRVLIGRDPALAVALGADTVSRHHACLTRESAGTYIEDLWSLNGTFVNGRRVEQRTLLADGDRLQLGDTTLLKFLVTDELEARALATLFELTLRDPLTRLHNRRYFDDHLQSELSFAQRHETPLALLLIDIDCFKQVNDSYGHQVGDLVLKQIAGAIRGMMRPEDVVSRYGGEEFIVIARNISARGARTLGERIRRLVQDLPFRAQEREFHVTVSIGVCGMGRGFAPVSGDELVLGADLALYKAKHAGRNRVCSGRIGDQPPPNPEPRPPRERSANSEDTVCCYKRSRATRNAST